MSPSVIGLDLSLTKTGIAGASGVTFLSKGGNGDARLVRLRDDLVTTIKHAEDLNYGQLFAVLEDLPKQAMGAGLTGRAQGVARELLSRRGIPVATVAPATLKLWAAGNGRATKEDMIAAAQMHAGIEGNTWVVGRKLSDDEADAYLLRSLGLAWMRGDRKAKGNWDQWIEAIE